MADEHYYLGIDLGTTNSSIHWAVLDPDTRRIEPRELSFDQLVGDGKMERRTLLPSFIYFRQDDPHPVVGEYARTYGLRGQPSRVACSIKTQMGRHDWRFRVDDKEYTAAQLSAMLLQTLLAGIRATWREDFANFTDVVITVPASFDSDMRDDTLEAARLAGFKTCEAGGAPRNLLLDEPRASLYDLLNQQRAGRIPAALIEFSEPKTVLVFDLGGGTLDVSLHRVVQEADGQEPAVDDLAISRYTQLGGDVFDALIADELQRRFEERHGFRLDSLSPTDRRLARFVLEAEAEQAKRRLTTDIEHRLPGDTEIVPDDFAVDVHHMDIVNGRGLHTRFSKKDFYDAVQTLLGVGLSLQDLDRFETLSSAAEPNNIIYPVLDVLRKAQIKLGEAPCVDAVVLSGGMTRVHAIRDRLQEFFGIRPLTVLNPDLSVSRGAALYHNMLHRGLRARQILAESIGVEVTGRHVYQLIPAGTVLPVRRVFSDLFEVTAENATSIRLPLYRGEAGVPEFPNKKILERRFVLSGPQPAGEPLDVEISIDENKLVRFMASLKDMPSERVVVEVGAEERPEKEAVRSAVPAPPPPAPNRPSGPALDTDWLKREIRYADASYDVQGFKALEPQVMKASNSQAVADTLIASLPGLKRVGKERVLFMIGELARLYPAHERITAMTRACLQHLPRSPQAYDKQIATVGRSAVVALGKIGSPVAESALIAVLGRTDVDTIRDAVLISLGKCAHSINAMRHVERYVDADRNGERIAALWAIGRMGSRERPEPLPIAELTDLVTKLCPLTDPNYEGHSSARKHAVYALGEICDRRSQIGHRDRVTEEYADLVIRVLNKVTGRQPLRTEEERQIQQHAQIALRMVQGETLSPEETEALMAVRTLMSVGK